MREARFKSSASPAKLFAAAAAAAIAPSNCLSGTPASRWPLRRLLALPASCSRDADNSHNVYYGTYQWTPHRRKVLHCGARFPWPAPTLPPSPYFSAAAARRRCSASTRSSASRSAWPLPTVPKLSFAALAPCGAALPRISRLWRAAIPLARSCASRRRRAAALSSSSDWRSISGGRVRRQARVRRP